MAGTDGAIGNVVKSKTLTTMAMGYSRSRVLCAAARLGVVDALGDGERTVDQLAAQCRAEPASLHRLLRALASLGVVVESAPARFVLTPLGKPLRKDAPDSEWAAVIFWSDLLADFWSYLEECIRTGDNAMRVMEAEGIASRWSKDPNAMAIFQAVMGTAPAEDYMPIARAWEFSNCKTVADLGGGGGALLAAVLHKFPILCGMLVDRQESIDKAVSRFEKDGLLPRCKLLAAGAEVYMMKHVLHGYDDGAAMEILFHCRSAVPTDGRLLVIEFVLPDVVDHADLELEHKLMSDLNMLAVTGGKERSEAEWRSLLCGAGFECRCVIPVPGDSVSIIEAAPRR